MDGWMVVKAVLKIACSNKLEQIVMTPVIQSGDFNVPSSIKAEKRHCQSRNDKEIYTANDIDKMCFLSGIYTG
jgi:hypothetical protein